MRGSTSFTALASFIIYVGLLATFPHPAMPFQVSNVEPLLSSVGSKRYRSICENKSQLSKRYSESSSSFSLYAAISATTTGPSSEGDNSVIKSIRSDGGPLAFNTPYGALNPYGIFYGLTSIGLGIIWYASISICRALYFLTRNRFDPKRRIPIFLSHIWGMTLMKLTGGSPKIENLHILKEFYQSNRAGMFVANHNSWQDIPYLGKSIGWRNYKMIAKKELAKVPILGAAIYTGGHVFVDRTDRRSQLMTLKSGIQWLKDGVHLCTFPEGTRSRDGHLKTFKKGAFKMAYKTDAPIIPISIVASGKVHPSNFMFPKQSAKRGGAKVVIHEPVECVGKTEDELAEAVRDAIISGLPEDQKPLA